MKKNALEPAELVWQQQVPFAAAFGDCYFSQQDGLNETRYHFLAHNFLPERFAALGNHSKSAPFRIAESGFGSGLNFLATLALWQQTWGEQKPSVQLHFVSFEKYPLRWSDLVKVHSTFAELAPQAEALQAIYPPLIPGWHELYLPECQVRLSLWFGDILDGVKTCDSSPPGQVDAWFLDGFAPSKNPQMWQPALFQNMARLSHGQTTFATFTAAGDVRRGLQQVGFTVQKDKGFGRKREMLFGQLETQRPFTSKAPWFERSVPSAPVKTVLVIGAGLAGATQAYALAQQGLHVTVLDQADAVAAEASGNLAGTLHPLLTADWNLRSRWYWAGFQSAQRWLQPWLSTQEIEGDLRGLLQLDADGSLLTHWQQVQQNLTLPPRVAQWQEADALVSRWSIETDKSGLFYPNSGWIYPKSVVERCLAHPNIAVKLGHRVEAWQSVEGGWQVKCFVGKETALLQADALVLATAALDQNLNQRLQLPLRPLKGQVTHLPAALQAYPLPIAITHSGYSSPTAKGYAVTGATFEAPDMGQMLSVAGHQSNLTAVEAVLPNWQKVQSVGDLEGLPGRIAFRPTTPDHLPIVGPVPDWAFVDQHYLRQPHNRALFQYPRQSYQPHLYVNNGHGARGLMSVFLAAELITAEMCGQSLPLDGALYQATHPARFAIRPWRSGKTLS
ncbi:MAG: bifunctional tRNA (5-methylaminomethyl-2-thiouridine)(34)-methyltransferase MnmD/FAD-dependent 5-carboxymethylaminomethyl-2-thiouridine(34) oxidoreductase MnmC [Thiotrichales bacterium]|nr:bifunctional tRNA (5-methylaminomethyl-2-thiouridine)(34)-methyltransferase MnmD/FAD-dependent 5-carboxymethylaminomethyl-2-thiouridine(34) oxidoreductase MnmC [Thiotrichales bacterium]